MQDFFSHEGLSVENTLKRTHLLTCNLYEDLLSALAKNDRQMARNLAARDDDVDRLRFLLLRQIRLALNSAALLRELDLDASDCMNYALVIRDVEQIADRLGRVAKYFSETPETKAAAKVQKKTEELNRQTYEMYKAAMESFLKSDAAKANAALGAKQAIYVRRDDLEREISRSQAVPFQYGVILDSIMGIAELASEIAEVAINKG